MRWTSLGNPGAKDIGVAGEGDRTHVFVVTKNDAPLLWDWSTASWDPKMRGNGSWGGYRITAEEGGRAWVVGGDNSPYVWKEHEGWFNAGGAAFDISAWRKDDVWIVSRQNEPMNWNGSSYVWCKPPKGESGFKIAVDEGGLPFLVTATGSIWRRKGVNVGASCEWQRIASPAGELELKDVQIYDVAAGGGALWVLARKADPDAPSAYYVFKWKLVSSAPDSALEQSTGADWTYVPTPNFNALGIGADQDGLPWIADRQGEVWRGERD